MASLESLIYSRLTGRDELKNKLTTYNGLPAIFYQSAPNDVDEGWDNNVQYPRMEFIVDTHTNPERQTQGTLLVNIICSETGVMPEEVVPIVNSALCDVFFSPDDHDVFALSWAHSESFTMQKLEKEPLIIGVAISFDLYEFPNQETSDPDPVVAINYYVKNWDKAAVVIGMDCIDDFYTPTRKEPAFYFREVSSQIESQTNTVVWLNATLAAHVFAPTLKARNEWVMAFANAVALAGEVRMLDGSPMFLLNIKGNSAADEQDGQLRINVKYGLLRRPVYAHTMENMKLN